MSEGLKTQLKHVGFDVVGEIRDADHDLNIFINESDVQTGQVGNPMACTTAKCLQRAIGQEDTQVAVFLNVAYVQLPGVAEVRRYVVPERLRRDVVIPQDKGTAVTTGTYSLFAPTESRQLGYEGNRREFNRIARKQAEALGMVWSPKPTRAKSHDKHVRLRWQRHD